MAGVRVIYLFVFYFADRYQNISITYVRAIFPRFHRTLQVRARVLSEDQRAIEIKCRFRANVLYPGLPISAEIVKTQAVLVEVDRI